MQCRTVYESILSECDGVAGVGSTVDSIRLGLDAFDQVHAGKHERLLAS